jgi:NTE family protein
LSNRFATRWRAAGLTLTALVLGGCASARFEDQPLAGAQPNAERRQIDLSHPDRPLLLVAISGGGSRAAALGWTVLHELSGQRYVSDGAPRSLADDIGVVSSVSGGSVIAADFALNGKAGLDRFDSAFLRPDNMEALAVDIANPFSLLASAFSGGSRTDRVVALFDDRLFDHAHFSALNQPGHPYLVMNATDMATGEVFAFTPNRFDDICADLDAASVSTGVAASSAVPIALAPIALKNYSGTGCPAEPASDWPALELRKTFSPYIDVETYKRARYENDLRRGDNAFQQIDYLYLLDGGLADNLAVHGLLEALIAPNGPGLTAAPSAPATLLRAMNIGAIRKLAVLVINARAEPDSSIAITPSLPGLGKMFGAVVSVPIDSTTASVSAQIGVLMDTINGAAQAALKNAGFSGMQVYKIDIDFDQLRAPEQAGLRHAAKNVPTSWTITKANRDVIVQAGTTLLHQHPCYQKLLLDMGIASPFVDAGFASTGCPTAQGH